MIVPASQLAFKSILEIHPAPRAGSSLEASFQIYSRDSDQGRLRKLGEEPPFKSILEIRYEITLPAGTTVLQFLSNLF